MGKAGATVGPLEARDDTNRTRGTAALLAVLWPSLLGPEHGADWRAQNRRIWRRRLSHLGLVAGIMGVSTLAAAPPFHRPGERDAPHDRAGRWEHTHRGPAGGAGDDRAGAGERRLLITFRDLHDRNGPPDSVATASPETAGDHLVNAVQGPDDHGLRQPWGPASYDPRPARDLADFSGGGGGGGQGGSGYGGGGGGRGGGSSDGPSQGDGASPGDPGAPGQQTDAGASGGPQTSDDPPYVVDPDDGPHQTGDPQWPPKDWRPRASAPQPRLSPVPEPHTWLMMIAGFAAIGASLRMRRRIGARAVR